MEGLHVKRKKSIEQKLIISADALPNPVSEHDIARPSRTSKDMSIARNSGEQFTKTDVTRSE